MIQRILEAALDMPYMNENAPRLGHVRTASSEAVQDALARWKVAQAKPSNGTSIASLCVPVGSLTSSTPAKKVRFSITVDGSETEVEATRDHPTVKVGYIRVAGSLLELDRLADAGKGQFVNPRIVSEAHKAAAFDAALPGSGLVRPGSTGVETWRAEVDHFMQNTRFDNASRMTLSDALLTLHGSPGKPANFISLRTCPSCESHYPPGGEAKVEKSGGRCPACQAHLYLADVLRTHEEYSEEGSNQSAITRIMNLSERLMTLFYLDLFFSEAADPVSTFSSTLFVTDGPLALYGTIAPLKRRFHEYLQHLVSWSAAKSVDLPLLVGVEKSGRFVEHAEIIKDLIPKGHVMRLTTDYINRITGRSADNKYGIDEFYGRRFIYRTTAGDPLVITIPPRHGVQPYQGPESEELDSYPTLRTVCEVLDEVRTRLYPNAVIPVALAHNSAALPLGVGHSVLRELAQKGVGLPQDSQIRYRNPYR